MQRNNRSHLFCDSCTTCYAISLTGTDTELGAGGGNRSQRQRGFFTTVPYYLPLLYSESRSLYSHAESSFSTEDGWSWKLHVTLLPDHLFSTLAEVQLQIKCVHAPLAYQEVERQFARLLPALAQRQHIERAPQNLL